MKRFFTALALLMVLASCGGKKEAAAPVPSSEPAASAPAKAAAPAATTAPTPDATPAGETKPAAEPQAVAASDNTMLYFYDDVLATDQPKKPSFELQTPKFAMTEDKVWQVERATAIAYGKDGSETRFIAEAGVFDENTKTAKLSGGVSVTFGTQKVALQDMTWTNETHSAVSENPVTVTDGETNLKAARMEYHADNKTLVLHNLSGTVSMKEAQQQ